MHHMQHQHDCQFQCPHIPSLPLQQHQLPQQNCFGHNCTFMPPVAQPSAIHMNHPNITSPVFDDDGFQTDVDVNTSPTELYLPNVPVSLASSLSLANLTPADLQ